MMNSSIASEDDGGGLSSAGIYIWLKSATVLSEEDAQTHGAYLLAEGITSVEDLRYVDDANDWNDLKLPAIVRSKIKIALRKKLKEFSPSHPSPMFHPV